MGLTHPHDLAAWQRWQARRNLPRLVRSRLRPGPPTRAALAASDPGARVLVALDSRSPTSLAALVRPSERLAAPVATVEASDVGTARPLEPAAWDDLLPDLSVVVALGHYLEVGGFGYRLARRRGVPFVTVQHGLLAPSMAPLSPGTHLLAWSDADAAFWRSGREDVTHEVVGSQLLWDAAHLPRVTTEPDTRPVYLGQLHGAELRRADLARNAGAFCLAEHATYRPHPSERDRRSLAQHARWARRGIEIDRSGTPLVEVRRPVVSAFSTGVLESAARGMDAWVHFDRPPAWLAGFWERYGMRRWGGEPTPAPHQPVVEPAGAVAAVLTRMMEPRR